MKRTTLLLLILLTGVYLFANQSSQGLRRFAMFVGSNDGGHERVRLRYAESDARALPQPGEGGLDGGHAGTGWG